MPAAVNLFLRRMPLVDLALRQHLNTRWCLGQVRPVGNLLPSISIPGCVVGDNDARFYVHGDTGRHRPPAGGVTLLPVREGQDAELGASHHDIRACDDTDKFTLNLHATGCCRVCAGQRLADALQGRHREPGLIPVDSLSGRSDIGGLRLGLGALGGRRQQEQRGDGDEHAIINSVHSDSLSLC